MGYYCTCHLWRTQSDRKRFCLVVLSPETMKTAVLGMKKDGCSPVRFICSLSFLFGGAVGSAVCFLCSDPAILRIRGGVLRWLSAGGPNSLFAFEILLVLLALFCAASMLGFLLLPVLNCFFGFCLSLEIISLLQPGLHFAPRDLALVSMLFPVLPLLRISAVCSQLSLRVARACSFDGSPSYDLRPAIRTIWIALLLMFITLLLQRLLLMAL